MTIPESQRVVYEKNPLDEVICQLRFPAILKIDSQEPAGFQEAIRKDYPIFEEPQGLPVERGAPPIPPEMLRVMGAMGIKTRPVYKFKSADDRWTVALAREFVALTDRDYETWETFKAHLEAPLNALQSEYQPAFFTRIGLRYRDVIRRSELGLADVPWSELLAPHIAGELGSLPEQEVEATTRQVEIRLETGRVRAVHGLAKDEETSESMYFIDADFFVEGRTEAKDVQTTLKFFNRRAGRLFRWCIGDRLHAAMRPNPL
jgi:uncharacterized protein (TIGR04255 family)